MGITVHLTVINKPTKLQSFLQDPAHFPARDTKDKPACQGGFDLHHKIFFVVMKNAANMLNTFATGMVGVNLVRMSGQVRCVV